jgi:hypothetical protein
MLIRELLESIQKQAMSDLPGAVRGIKIMTVDQFVQQSQPEDSKDGEVDEATKLSAPSRAFGGQEFQDYMTRTKGTDLPGKFDKKTGKQKYKSDKLKTDKYKMPYIHRSSAIQYMLPDGKTYDEEAIKRVVSQRPSTILKQNEKMAHSNGELEQFFNVGFAALIGVAVDESANQLIIVNTCPGAGSCKVDCYAMGGGFIQYEAGWLSRARLLTFLLNDPDGFFTELSEEITKEQAAGNKGGYKVSIRWHDAGDFFSPEYMQMAFDFAKKFPNIDFYAYTKIASAVLSKKPDNFMINWSEGASPEQEKQVKATDPELKSTKNSRIVPDELFQDLLKKDSKGKLIKTAGGAWQPDSPAALKMLKDRLAKEYNLKPQSILTYDEMMATPQKSNIQKWNVIIAPGEGDISAKRSDVLSTLLLKH